MSASTLDTRDRVYAGILLTGLSYFLFTVHDAAVKLLVATIPVWQVLFFRSLTILAGCLVFGGRQVFAEAARFADRSADVPALVPDPVGMALLLHGGARPAARRADDDLLRRADHHHGDVGLHPRGRRCRWPAGRAVALGFVGVFVACDPADLGVSLPVLLVLAAAFLWGLSIVLLRKIAMQEKTIVQMILNNSFFLVTAGLPLIYLWQTPSLGQAALLFGAGSLAGFAQFALFEGMKRAPASVIAPFEYTALVWSFLLGYLIWGDVPRSGVFRGRLDDRRGRR